jgi:hypothetical protein
VKYRAISLGHVEWRSGENMRVDDAGGRCRRSSKDGTPVLISVGRGGGAVEGMRRVKDGMVDGQYQGGVVSTFSGHPVTFCLFPNQALHLRQKSSSHAHGTDYLLKIQMR